MWDQMQNPNMRWVGFFGAIWAGLLLPGACLPILPSNTPSTFDRCDQRVVIEVAGVHR